MECKERELDPLGKEVSWTAELETTKEIKVLNYGLCGDCTDDIFDRPRYTVLPEHVRHIVFMVGANDVLNGVPVASSFKVDRPRMGNVSKTIIWCCS